MGSGENLTPVLLQRKNFAAEMDTSRPRLLLLIIQHTVATIIQLSVFPIQSAKAAEIKEKSPPN